MSDYLDSFRSSAQKSFDQGAVVSPVAVLTVVGIAERQQAILTDLIAELRGYADVGYIMGASTMRELCDRAEQDLREVSGA